MRRIMDGIAHFARVFGEVNELFAVLTLIVAHVFEVSLHDHLAQFAFDRYGITPVRRGRSIEQRQQTAPFQFFGRLVTGDSAKCRH